MQLQAGKAIRDRILTPCFVSIRDVQYVKGVGPRRAALLTSRGIRTVGDLLLRIPRAYQDRATFVESRLFAHRSGCCSSRAKSIAAVPSKRVRAAAFSTLSSRTEPASPMPNGFMAAPSAWPVALPPDARSSSTAASIAINHESKFVFFNPEFELLDEAEETPGSASLDVGRIVPIYEEIGGHHQPAVSAHHLRRLWPISRDPLDDPIPPAIREASTAFPICEPAFSASISRCRRRHRRTEPSSFAVASPTDLRRILSARTRVRPSQEAVATRATACASKPAMRSAAA